MHYRFAWRNKVSFVLCCFRAAAGKIKYLFVLLPKEPAPLPGSDPEEKRRPFEVKLLAADWWCFRSPATFFLAHRASRITVPKILAFARSLARLLFPQSL